jgi:tetratricopeptide (TPR) repeat protein
MPLLREEIEINPRFAPAYYYLGEISMQHTQYPEAAAFFEKAEQIDPRCVDAYVGLGKAYALMSKWENALVEFQRANAIDPGQDDIHYWLGTTYRRLGERSKSLHEIKIYQSIVKNRRYGAVNPGKQTHERWVSSSCLPEARWARPIPAN